MHSPAGSGPQFGRKADVFPAFFGLAKIHYRVFAVFTSPAAALSCRRGCYKKSARVMQKDLSVARGDKKRKNGRKSRSGVLHPLFFILLLLLTIRSK